MRKNSLEAHPVFWGLGVGLKLPGGTCRGDAERAAACKTFVEVWWCGSVLFRSCRLCQQLQLAGRPSGLNTGPWSTKELEDVRRSSVLSMAQAEAMVFRLGLERSAERCSIVRPTGTFEKKNIFKVENSTCIKKGRRSFFQLLLWRNLVASCCSFVAG